MRKLTKIIAPAVVAIAALGSAGVASAQPYPGYGRDGMHATPGRT